MAQHLLISRAATSRRRLRVPAPAPARRNPVKLALGSNTLEQLDGGRMPNQRASTRRRDVAVAVTLALLGAWARWTSIPRHGFFFDDAWVVVGAISLTADKVEEARALAKDIARELAT